MTVANEIRKLKMQKSAELRAREARASKRQAKSLEGKLKSNRAPGAVNDPSFMAQLERKAREARERAGEGPRPDLEKALAVARKKGHLPPGHTGGTGYVPTAEEILGDQALPKPAVLQTGRTEALPDAEDVLNSPSAVGDGTPVEGSAFTREELDEIRRMNPGPAKGGGQRGKRR